MSSVDRSRDSSRRICLRNLCFTHPRNDAMGGRRPMQPQDIFAWCSEMGVELDPEVEPYLLLDEMGKFRGIAFVTIADGLDLEESIDKLDGKHLDGRDCWASKANPPAKNNHNARRDYHG